MRRGDKDTEMQNEVHVKTQGEDPMYKHWREAFYEICIGDHIPL
jgi:hypothetical protein